MRCAFTSAMPAATAPRRVSSGGASAGAGAGAGGAGAETWPFPSAAIVSSRRASPGWVATSSLEPLSKSARHSVGTASGFSRYSSSRSRA